MSSLFEEAIADAKKLKEVAEQNAKNAIINSISPIIKNMIDKEIESMNENNNLLFEENTLAVVPTSEVPLEIKDQNLPIAVSSQEKIVQQPGSQEPSAPETVASPEQQALIPNDKISQEELNIIPNDEQEQISYETYSVALESFKEKLMQSKTLNEVAKVYFKEQLLNIYEILEQLKEKKEIPEKIISLNENYLEFLYKKIKEGKSTNNYNRNMEIKEGKKGMPNLKTLAKKLFEDADAGFNDELKTGVTNKADKTAEKAGNHAMKETKPNVDTSTAAAPKKMGSPEEKFWNEELARLEEELNEVLQEENSTEENLDETESLEETPTATNEEVVEETAQAEEEKINEEAEEMDEVYEIDEKELDEAIRAIRKEAVKKQSKALKEDYESNLDECMDDSTSPGMETEHKIDLNINLTGLDADDNLSVMGDDGTAMDNLSVGGDEGEPSGDEEDMYDFSLDDEDDEESPEELHMEAKKSSKKKVQKKKAQSKLTENEAKLLGKIKTLEAQLAENQLFTAKLIYLNKFFQKESLSSKQKQKIVSYLDKAKTLEEAKKVYGTIKKVLEESNNHSQITGSSSKTTKSGSAVTIAESNESKQKENVESNRWMLLAGINKTKR